MSDPVEAQIAEFIERIPAVLERASKPLTIHQIADGLSYHTRIPWCVIFAVQRLERGGVLQRDRSRGNRAPWRYGLAIPDRRD